MDTIKNLYNFYWETIVPKTIFVPPELANKITPGILLSIGVPEDQIRLLIAMFVCFPLAYIHTLLPSPFLKKLFSIFFGVSILQFTFLDGWIHSLICSLIVYLLAVFAPRKSMPYIIFLFSLIYLSFRYILSILYFIIILVIYTLFIIIIWNDQHANDEGRLGRMYKHRQESYITSLPSLFDFLAYIYHFPGFLTGPAIFYHEYIETIEGKNSDSQHNPSRLPAAFKKMISGFTVLLLYAYLDTVFPIQDLVTEVSENWSLFHYILRCYICGLISRLKYHGMWKISESVCICDGFGYKGKDKNGKDQWNGLLNTEMIKCETSNSFSTFTKCWNKRTQQWLQRYIYQRTNGSLLCLYSVSAFWHGFYSGYYILFLTLAALQFVARQMNKKIYSRYKQNKYFDIVYNILSFFGVQISIAIFCCCFFMMSYENAYIIMNRTHWLGYIVIATLYIVLLFVPPYKEKSKLN